MSNRVVCSRTPVRIDFAGGWTDVPLFTTLVSGVVVNAAISLYTYTTIESIQDVPSYGFSAKERMNLDSIKMYSVDLDIYEEMSSITDIEYNGTMDLVKAACKQQGITGIEITTQSDAPPGSGLGTSASLGVAVLGALATYNNKKYGMRESYAENAFRLETEELKLLSGTQDQYAAALGGFNCFRCKDNEVSYHDNLNVVDPMFYELEKRLVLVYTGKSRLSSDIHSNVVESFNKRENHKALKNLVYTGELAREALLTRDIYKLATAMNMSWENQKLLHFSITNDQIEELFDIAKLNGMIAGKACGAGGGGCLLFLAERGREHTLKKVMEARGVKVLPFKFDFSGLQLWELFEGRPDVSVNY